MGKGSRTPVEIDISNKTQGHLMDITILGQASISNYLDDKFHSRPGADQTEGYSL